MALIDILRKKAGRMPAAQQTDVGALESQIVAGQTGRLQQQTGPGISGIGQQLAAQQVQAQQKGLQAQQLQATEQLSGQIQAGEERAALAEAGLEQQREQALTGLTAESVMQAQRRQAQEDAQAVALEAKSSEFSDKITNMYANFINNLASERGIVEQDLFNEFKREQASLSADKAAARLFQLGHVLALADRQYVDTITNIARERNLREDLNFQQESYELQMGQSMEIMDRRMDFTAALNKNAREFKEEMFNMDMDSALELANLAEKEQNYIAIMNGVSQGLPKVAGFLAGSGMFESDSTSAISPTMQNAAMDTYGGPSVQASQSLGYTQSEPTFGYTPWILGGQ